MTALPERTVEAAVVALVEAASGIAARSDVAAYGTPWTGEGTDTKFIVGDSPERALAAAMDPALGPDRLVVAGEYEREVRADQTRRIVEWLHGRSGAHGGGFSSADDVRCAIEREFGGGDDA